MTAVALYLMSQWVESNELATPTQQHRARKVSSLSNHDSCYYMYVLVPIQMMSRLQNGMETETCPICQTCILTITRLLAAANSVVALDPYNTAIPFTNYSRERCSNGHMWGK